jgi:Uma2 family endonuclease
MVAHPQAKYWTYEDLRALPDDGKRYEIIEGVLYEMDAPNMVHGHIIAMLTYRVLWPVVDQLAGVVYTAPIDVFLPGANPVQPDIFVLLPEQFGFRSARGVEGPPVLVVEVLSPNTTHHDLVRKRDLYARASVPEYWIVDPEAKSITVLVLEGGHYRTHAQVTGEETLLSVVFPDLAYPAARIFAM